MGFWSVWLRGFGLCNMHLEGAEFHNDIYRDENVQD